MKTDKAKPPMDLNGIVVDALIDTIKDQSIAILGETGLTPREILEQRDELADALSAMLQYYAPASFDTIKHGNEDALRHEVRTAHDALATTKGDTPA